MISIGVKTRRGSKTNRKDDEAVWTYEISKLEEQDVPIDTCPFCGAVFIPFLRGIVQRSPIEWRPWKLRRFLRCRPYCCLICQSCKEIVGYEDPYDYSWELTARAAKESHE